MNESLKAEANLTTGKVKIMLRSWDGIDKPEINTIIVMEWQEAMIFSNNLQEAISTAKSVSKALKVDTINAKKKKLAQLEAEVAGIKKEITSMQKE